MFPALLAVVSLGACDPGPDEIGPGASAGKADVFGIEEGSRAADSILRIANALDQTALDDEIGLTSAAARGIARTRAGADGELGTADDDAIDSLAELATIAGVKETAFGKLAAHARAHLLRVSSLNIRWYGLDGSLFGSFGSESRNETLRAFFRDQLAHRDLLVFQEIVDVELFLDELAGDLSCVTYDGKSGKHQHVLVCARPDLELSSETGDTDFAIEEVDIGGKLRPAVHAMVRNADGKDVAHLIAVHLKADPPNTQIRLDQAGVLADHIGELVARDPGGNLLAIGDFNTHQTDITGLAINDEDAIHDVLNASGAVELSRARHPVVHTFRKKNGVGFRLDQSWASPGLRLIGFSVPGECNLPFPDEREAIAVYFDDVSDHCALILDYLY